MKKLPFPAISMVVMGAVLFGVVSKAPAQEQRYTLKLKPQTVIVGPEISLLDVGMITPKSTEIQSKLAKINLGKAPPPGESKDIALSYIKLQLRHAGLQDLIPELNGPRLIRVSTAQRDITRIRLEEAVAGYVEEKFRDSHVEWKLDFRRLPEKLAVPLNDFSLTVEPQGKFRGRGYQVFRVSVRSDAVVITSTEVAAIIHTFENVAVAKHRLPVRTEIKPDDVEFTLQETTNFSAPPFTDPASLQNLQTIAIIPEGKAITRNTVAERPVIAKGDIVEVSVAAGNVVLHTKGLAQENGNQNDWIRIWNRETRRVIRGQVVDPGKVRVEL